MATETIYSVSDLNNASKMLLEHNFSNILLEGEISNFSCPSSGHWYFTLKDETAQIRCAMFRMSQNTIKIFPKDGMHVVVRAKVSLYTSRGEYQLIVSQMEDIGIGILQKRFETLKQKLLLEGLFDNAHKKALPHFPQKIGIITSVTGAAIQDALSVLKRRYPIAQIVIYPTLVQGDLAADNIVNMIVRANYENVCDVLLLTRGGGSLEDLWPFNEEKVARAIYHSHLPIIAGIGHEVDFTIADFVVDVRAPTPSAAAETLVPDKTEISAQISQKKKQLKHYLQRLLHQYHLKIAAFSQQLQQQHPKTKLSVEQQQLKHYQHKLLMLINQLISYQKNQIISFGKQLHQLSPLNTLDRGYAILLQNAQAVTSVKKLHVNDTLSARLKDGMISVTVTEIYESRD